MSDDSNGFSALHWAAYNGEVQKVKDILGSCGKQLSAVVNNSENESNVTPLQWACIRGDLEIVKLLLNAGASLEHRDALGQSAIMLAVQNSHLMLVFGENK
jgi:ankyrin repeat protein